MCTGLSKLCHKYCPDLGFEPVPSLRTRFPSSRSTAAKLELTADVEFTAVDQISDPNSFSRTRFPPEIRSLAVLGSETGISLLATQTTVWFWTLLNHMPM